jgi:CubicO group peptidase (beta-lactamase class C family)
MTSDPVFIYDWAFTDFVARTKQLADQGLRPLSLSTYGDPKDARFAAVWDKASGGPLRWFIGYTVHDFEWEYDRNTAQGYYPTLVSATGSGSNTRISGFFEPRPAAEATELTVDQDLATFASEVDRRARSGWIPLSATIYDDAGAAPRVAAVWERNTRNVAWRAVAGLSPQEHQAHFDAQWSGWARLAFVTGSTENRLLAVYRDDQIGPIGTGFVARHGLTREAFEKEYGEWFPKGFRVVCLQGYGRGDGRRFATLFVNSNVPVQRTLRMTGGPAVTEIDRAVTDLMKQSNIRGAALAIVQGTRLVLARGYTWAEPDYPTVQPTTSFRLASCSKLVAALGIHQLVAEGKLKLETTLPTALPLRNPDGTPPTNPEYLGKRVGELLQYGGRFHRYEGEGPNVAAAFNSKLPVTHAQIASYMLTKELLPTPKTTLDDFGYFLAGEVIKKARGAGTLTEALAPHITGPLHLTRMHTARSLLATQPAGEARHHPRDLVLRPSVMSPDQPLVPREYGDENLETMETSGGLSAAAPDLARVLAAFNARPYTPVGRPAVDSLLKHASIGGGNGHGFDWLELVDTATQRYRGPKGGLLQTSQSGIWYDGGDFSYVILWNGLHTGADLTLDPGDGPGWYPRFTRVLEAAATHAWPTTDLFPSYGMPSLPATESSWRWCTKCQGMFFSGGSTKITRCPAGAAHSSTGSLDYRLIRNSDFPYGQPEWRRCAKCTGLYYAGIDHGTCPASGTHDHTGSANYTLVLNSPYKEPQHDWRWCDKCQGLFYAGLGSGVCPAGGGHRRDSSGNYSVAGK